MSNRDGSDVPTNGVTTRPAASRHLGKRPWDTGVGGDPVDRFSVVCIAVILLIISLFLLYTLWQVWPPSGIADATGMLVAPDSNSIHLIVWDFSLPREKNFLVLVAVAGALGAMAYVLRSYFRYAGERYLVWSWVLSYFLIPVVGAIIATLVYILLRAGLISGGGVAQGDPFGFAAVAGLVGLFSAQAAEKLKQVFETIFAAPEAGGESFDDKSTAAPVIRRFKPMSGKPSDDVEVYGDALEEIKAVEFDGVSSKAEYDVKTGVLKTKVPAGAQPGLVPLSVTLTVPSGTVVAKCDTSFEVL